MNLPQALCLKKDQLSERNWPLLCSNPWSSSDDKTTSFPSNAFSLSEKKKNHRLSEEEEAIVASSWRVYYYVPWSWGISVVAILSSSASANTVEEGWLVLLWLMRLPPPGEKVWRVVHWDVEVVVEGPTSGFLPILSLDKYIWVLSSTIFHDNHNVWKLLKMSPIFVFLKVTCMVTLFDSKLLVFRDSPIWTIFWQFFINFYPLIILPTLLTSLAMLNATFWPIFKTL